jgi:hypothetical protein
MKSLKMRLLMSVFVVSTSAIAKNKEVTKKADEVRKPAQEFSLVECNKKSDLQLAVELLDFIANGGLMGQGRSKCGAALNSSSFAVIEPIEGDIIPRVIRINDGDKIEIIKNEERVHELGFKMNTWSVEYVIHMKNKKVKGQLEFSRSLSEEDVKIYGCGYLRSEPDQLFIRKSCEIR